MVRVCAVVQGELNMSESMDPIGLAERESEDVGGARLLDVEDVVAGEFGSCRLVFVVGAVGLGSGGIVQIGTDSDTDWGLPQVHDAGGADYLSVRGPDGAEIATQVVDLTTVNLVNTGRALVEGEEVMVTFGDSSGGGPGSRSQTFIEPRRYFWIEVDVDGSGHFVPIAARPELSVVGGDAVRLVVVAPSDAAAGEDFRISVKAEDRWGNPANAYRGMVSISGAGIAVGADEIEFDDECGGVVWIDGCRITETGEHRVVARDADAGLEGVSNPIVASETPSQLHLYWGDPHGGQVVDPYKIGDFFQYARDVAGIHFAGFQRNDPAISTGAYDVQQKAEREHYEPGRFVPLPGYEWSATTDRGGHHNVYFRRFDQELRRSAHADHIDDWDLETDLPHVREMHAEFRYSDVVVTPHVGGIAADLQYHEPAIEPALEITSTHGQFEWFLRESIERNYKMGFIGGSDCYTGRPGDDQPGHQLRRYQKAGLTGVYATELKLDAILAGMKARRVYATSGVRIVAAVSADGHMMGSEYSTAASPEISVKILGAGPLERVELFRGLELIHCEEMSPGRSENRVRVTWEGASRETSYSGVVWDGSVTTSGGSIKNVEKIRFDSPRSEITDSSDSGVSWSYWGCGYTSGLLLEIDGTDETGIEVALTSDVIASSQYSDHGKDGARRITFAAADRVRIPTKLGSLAEGPRRVELGQLDRAVAVEMAPEPGPQRVEFSVIDDSPKPGINPYWVRVTQSDMEKAWTSPVFVDYVAPV